MFPAGGDALDAAFQFAGGAEQVAGATVSYSLLQLEANCNDMDW